jgi:hypothetical protein
MNDIIQSSPNDQKVRLELQLLVRSGILEVSVDRAML